MINLAQDLDPNDIAHVQTQRNRLDSRMMKKVSQALRDADAVLAIVDCSTDPKDTLQSFNALLEARLTRDLPLAMVSCCKRQTSKANNF